MQSIIEASNTEAFNNNSNKNLNVKTDTIADVNVSDFTDMSPDVVHHEMHNNPSPHENLFQDSVRNEMLTHYNRIVIGSFKEFFQSIIQTVAEVLQALKELNFMLANRTPELNKNLQQQKKSKFTSWAQSVENAAKLCNLDTLSITPPTLQGPPLKSAYFLESKEVS